jgi:hypothetical protein
METKWELVRMELKYCERCGGLWMRTRGSQEVYCAPCESQLQDVPAVRRTQNRPRPANHRFEIKAQHTHASSGCNEGGNA